LGATALISDSDLSALLPVAEEGSTMGCKAIRNLLVKQFHLQNMFPFCRIGGMRPETNLAMFEPHLALRHRPSGGRELCVQNLIGTARPNTYVFSS
jgi:hypothetical protein